MTTAYPLDNLAARDMLRPASTSWNFSDDEPELITSTALLMDALRLESP